MKIVKLLKSCAKVGRNEVDLNPNRNSRKIFIFKPQLNYLNFIYNHKFLHQNKIEVFDFLLVFFKKFLNVIKLPKSCAKVGRNEVDLNLHLLNFKLNCFNFFFTCLPEESRALSRISNLKSQPKRL